MIFFCFTSKLKEKVSGLLGGGGGGGQRVCCPPAPPSSYAYGMDKSSTAVQTFAFHSYIAAVSIGILMIKRLHRGWSGGAMVLGKLPVPGRPTIWMTVGQGPTALALSAGGGCLDIFTLI